MVTSGATILLARDRFEVDLDQYRRALARAASSRGDARRAALAEAVRLYAGDLFADDPFEEWVQPHRDRLARQYLDTLALLAEAEEAAGEYQSAFLHWQDLADRDPGAEHACRGLMRAHLALGRGADALRAFEACRRALADLGAVPSPETMSLRARIPQAGTDAR
ncbi:MAG: bacterial transcriptional activator domain-containing protein [Armatimonadota bacterium]|nr:bacterial transcriptional activator domain-containing protein [Armatimonadota bacterium]